MSTKQFQLSRQQSYKNLKISRELRDIIHGYIMSDGYVKPEGCLTIDQSQKQHKFVQWLYAKLESIRTTHPISDVERKDKRTNQVTYSSRFNTRRLLHGFRSMWYGNSQKALPKNLSGFFSPECISVWFAGDGTKILGSIGAKIEVTNLTPLDRERLKALFKAKYNISVTICRAGKSKKGNTQWTLNINSEDYPKFKALITKIDLIPRLFPYKLH
jgi:hypothetical protein